MPRNNTNPTAYWVVRECDFEAFNLIETRDNAIAYANDCEQSFNEQFTVKPETQVKIPFCELPNAWEHDWKDRVPTTITITNIPNHAENDE